MAAGEGIRGMIVDLAHRPLSGERALGYLWNIGLGLDLCLEKLNQGIHGRLIDDCDESFLAFIGADRGVPRGLTESADSYRARLKRAIDDYQRAGNAWAVLSQVLGYLLADTPAARTVLTYYDTATGAPELSDWQRYSAGRPLTLPPVASRSDPADWNWDELTPTEGSWGSARWYLVLEAVAPHNWTDVDGTWGSGGLWGDGGAWGVTASPLVGRSIVLIVGKWKAGYAHWIIVSFASAEFKPGAAVNPDGLYGRWSKLVGGVYVRSRSSNARYFRGQ